MNESDDAVVRTWDGEPVSSDPPFGAMIVVYRWLVDEPAFLVLHRGQLGPDFNGDWAWGPPSGARYPGEDIDVCAARELFEETGFDLALSRAIGDASDWYVYLADEAENAEPLLSEEHDRFAWLPLESAASRITPEFVRTQFIEAASQLPRRSQSNRQIGRGSLDT